MSAPQEGCHRIFQASAGTGTTSRLLCAQQRLLTLALKGPLIYAARGTDVKQSPGSRSPGSSEVFITRWRSVSQSALAGRQS